MRIIVCGGRDYSDMDKVNSVLDELHAKRPITLVIEGGATGADRMGAMWAFNNHVQSKRIDADWKTHGHAAGPIRNRRMLSEGSPALVVAFPGGSGTANMIKQAKEFGVEVLCVC